MCQFYIKLAYLILKFKTSKYIEVTVMKNLKVIISYLEVFLNMLTKIKSEYFRYLNILFKVFQIFQLEWFEDWLILELLQLFFSIKD